MSSLGDIQRELKSDAMRERVAGVYNCRDGETDQYIQRLLRLTEDFGNMFGCDVDGADGARECFVCTAAGRTEICGNHTDHQRGHVLAASVNLDAVAVVSPNGSRFARLYSKGHGLTEVDIDDRMVHPEEINTTAALVRGIIARTAELGFGPCGFDAYVISDVPVGSGLSSSACYEVLVGVAVNHLYCMDSISLPEIAMTGQYAENVYFGKPSGLMDQTACAVGGIISIDFAVREAPVIRQVDFDFSAAGHALCIIDTGASHADLTDDYAAIPAEMKAAADFLGREVLREVPEEEFFRRLPEVRKELGDRTVLRAMHYYAEDARVTKQVEALEGGDFDRFLALAGEAGRSSFMYLQNVSTYRDPGDQPVAVALAAAEHLLGGRGCVRVQGGGFAGTIQAFVPFDMLESFRNGIDMLLGAGACRVLTIRPVGGAVLL